MLEVGWRRSAQLDGDGWWCAVDFFAGTRGAPDLQMLPTVQAGLYLDWQIFNGAMVETKSHVQCFIQLVAGTGAKSGPWAR